MASYSKTPEHSRRVAKERRRSLPTVPPRVVRRPLEGALGPFQDLGPYSKYPAKLEVLEAQEIVIVKEEQTAYFQCKTNMELNPICTWYRNGVQIDDDQRTTIWNDGEWQKLRIRDTQVLDHGLYILQCKHHDRYINVYHRLYVCPRKRYRNVFFLTQNYFKDSGVLKHLINTKVYNHDTIIMEAIFAHEAVNYIWFKNNEELIHDNRTTMNKHATRATITITDAKTTDTGIYYVMAKSNYGYFCSFSDVVVLKPNDKRPLLPLIEEYPSEINGQVGEEVRICAKVQIDADTMIKWGCNKATIVRGEVKQIDYGNNYIGLIIPSPKTSSAGEYQLLMANSRMQQIVQATLKLAILEPPPLSLPMDVPVVRKLESAVACCGAQISFDCSFALRGMLYFYVVWHVGHYRITHSNSLFTLVCDKGQFLLIIHSFEPGMAGEVICELRRAHPNRKSVNVQRCYAHLTCVPQCVVESFSRLSLTSNLFRCATTRSLNGSSDEIKPDPRSEEFMDEDYPRGFLLKFVLCKVDDDNLYFTNTTFRHHHPRGYVCFHISETTSENPSTLVEWSDSHAKPGVSYRIETLLGDGTYADMGVISTQSFRIYEVPTELMMVFRITEAPPLLQVRESGLTLVPPPKDSFKISPIRYRQSEEAFYETFIKTGYNIGVGKFGCVTLVRHRTEQIEYAAKVIKIRIGNRRENAFREFDIMKQLSHPKIVQLFGLYETKLSLIFVMEYCWGGELFDRVANAEYMQEMDVVHYVRQICEALEYIADKGIVHLDIKPENIICTNPNSTNIKIIDFGVARKLEENSLRTVYGTREYVAPEVLAYERISPFSDMWSVGVVTYVLLSGLMPFAGNNWYERSISICTVNYDFNDDAFEEVSGNARDFVDQLLIRRPELRMTAREALQHIWIREGPLREAGSNMTKMRANLKTYWTAYKRLWLRAGNVMIAAHRLRMLANPKPFNEKIKTLPELL